MRPEVARLRRLSEALEAAERLATNQIFDSKDFPIEGSPEDPFSEAFIDAKDVLNGEYVND